MHVVDVSSALPALPESAPGSAPRARTTERDGPSGVSGLELLLSPTTATLAVATRSGTLIFLSVFPLPCLTVPKTIGTQPGHVVVLELDHLALASPPLEKPKDSHNPKTQPEQEAEKEREGEGEGEEEEISLADFYSVDEPPTSPLTTSPACSVPETPDPVSNNATNDASAVSASATPSSGSLAPAATPPPVPPRRTDAVAAPPEPALPQPASAPAAEALPATTARAPTVEPVAQTLGPFKVKHAIFQPAGTALLSIDAKNGVVGCGDKAGRLLLLSDGPPRTLGT